LNRFRSDLYFRLAVILLHLPPLRERGDDALVLAEHFLRRFSAKYGKDVRRIDAPARQVLLSYPWPGNVRELSHVIERAVLWSRDATLNVEHLSVAAPMRVAAESPYSAAMPAETALPPESTDLTQVERSMIERALREAGGNQTRAAQRLGISRDTLRYRLKKFGIQGG
jgi:two-component system, NtrC family, response regulator AtoC